MSKREPVKVNNFKVNKPVVAKSKNIQPLIYIEKREVEEVKPVVNGEVADEKLIHKPKKKEVMVNPPVIKKGAKKSSKTNRRPSSR
jgi:hypothetical protein